MNKICFADLKSLVSITTDFHNLSERRISKRQHYTPEYPKSTIQVNSRTCELVAEELGLSPNLIPAYLFTAVTEYAGDPTVQKYLRDMFMYIKLANDEKTGVLLDLEQKKINNYEKLMAQHEIALKEAEDDYNQKVKERNEKLNLLKFDFNKQFNELLDKLVYSRTNGISSVWGDLLEQAIRNKIGGSDIDHQIDIVRTINDDMRVDIMQETFELHTEWSKQQMQEIAQAHWAKEQDARRGLFGKMARIAGIDTDNMSYQIMKTFSDEFEQKLLDDLEKYTKNVIEERIRNGEDGYDF